VMKRPFCSPVIHLFMAFEAEKNRAHFEPYLLYYHA
jgi:hypothetical protein